MTHLQRVKPQNDGRRMMTAVYRWFENWVYPFREPANFRPPLSVGGFLWHYVGQAKFAFFAMLVIGGIAPLIEAGLFYFVGRLVDILDQLPERSWHALWTSAGPELVFMAVVVLVIRTIVVGLSALVDEQTITPGFYNLVRWQAHRHVSRQSYAFFQNDFAGRIATKVWQAGQATGDLMESFIEVVWFMIVYTVTTLALIAGLDLRLAVLVVIWISAFGFLAKLYLPAIRKHAEETAEAGSMITGRIVDSYSNVQTLKLFSADGDDRYHRERLRHLSRRASPVHPPADRRAHGADHAVWHHDHGDRLFCRLPLGRRLDHRRRGRLHAVAGAAAQHAARPFDDAAQQHPQESRRAGKLQGADFAAARPDRCAGRERACRGRRTDRREKCRVPLRQGVWRAQWHRSHRAAGRKGRVGRTVRRGQDDIGQFDPAALRPRRREDHHRRPGRCQGHAELVARQYWRRQPGYRTVPPFAARQHQARHA
ncbi:membrane hypothetical protein [Mesorhizobium metallidurans STM 2683]|uniref:ABC transmembrane type-1 domain-containing protein n=1 Tax=Mesorhizobium metallidurans STM 2683 TaxID=1297569 RepID=M5EXE7_9HYPH|nr:membrane hypothetical protein [Mesorhizobium metallidurans STM 2683]